jgi:hypothetical protein
MAGEWHMPFINDIDFKETDEMFFGEGRFDPYGQVELLKKVSVARCARVSYLTHDGRKSFKDDIELHDKLAKDGHWSPFEHVAMAQFSAGKVWSGNFYGWHQYRAVIDRHFTRVGINEINKG